MEITFTLQHLHLTYMEKSDISTALIRNNLIEFGIYSRFNIFVLLILLSNQDKIIPIKFNAINTKIHASISRNKIESFLHFLQLLSINYISVLFFSVYFLLFCCNIIFKEIKFLSREIHRIYLPCSLLTLTQSSLRIFLLHK